MMATTETINGMVFETRKLPAKGSHNGRVLYYIDGQQVGADTYARERNDARFTTYVPAHPRQTDTP
jgi:hypothetical protein